MNLARGARVVECKSCARNLIDRHTRHLWGVGATCEVAPPTNLLHRIVVGVLRPCFSDSLTLLLVRGFPRWPGKLLIIAALRCGRWSRHRGGHTRHRPNRRSDRRGRPAYQALGHTRRYGTVCYNRRRSVAPGRSHRHRGTRHTPFRHKGGVSQRSAAFPLDTRYCKAI